MRDGWTRRGRSGVGVLATLLAFSAVPALGQVPQPEEPNINQRSGLIRRFVPIIPHLPPDPRRDNWYDTRVGDRPAPQHLNTIKGQGLYGRFWPVACSARVYPFFYGSPGASTLSPDCKPDHPCLRVFRNFLHPFKPVGMYYDQGSYVPIYDLDPIVPGPGPYPVPWYFTGPRGG